jgi:hypothetical protein
VAAQRQRAAQLAGDLERLTERHWRKVGQRPHGVGLGVQRQGRRMARAALPVGVDGLFFQQAAAVGQQDLAQVVSGFAAQDLARKPFLTSSGR